MLRLYTRCLALVVLLIFVTSVAVQASPEDELERRRQELLRVQQEIEEQKQNILLKKRQEKSVAEELRRLEYDLERTKKELAVVEAELELTNKKAADTEVELKRLQAELERRSGYLSARLRALYEVGPTGYLEVLLASTDFSDFLSRFDFLQSLVAQDVKLLKSIKAEREQYLAKKAELENHQARLESLKDQKERKRIQVASRASDRERYLDKLQRERQEYERALDELEQLSEELTKVIQELQSKHKVAPAGKLSFSWPVVGRLVSGFGRRLHPILRRYRNHTGIDIAVRSGTPVKAAESGLVLHSGWLGGYGKTVIIDHGGGMSTLYAHNSSLSVSTGQTVTKGQVIALSGSTGLSTGPHVHFEVRVNGTPVDPMGYLR